MKRPILLALLLCAAASRAAEPTLVASADGASVVDAAARLQWARCVEGQSWTGKACEGSAQALTHNEAIAHAQQRSQAEGVHWRVPRHFELERLYERQAHADTRARSPFAAAPKGWYWSSSTPVETATLNPYSYRNIQGGVTDQNVNRVAYLHAWAVNVDSGERRADRLKRDKLWVRLVRDAEPAEAK
jgi:hypothetical protein